MTKRRKRLILILVNQLDGGKKTIGEHRIAVMREVLLKHQSFERFHRLAEIQQHGTHFDHGQP